MTLQHPRQRAIIKLNGMITGTLIADYPHPRMRWTFILPRRLFRSGEIARIDFELPDAAAPRLSGDQFRAPPFGAVHLPGRHSSGGNAMKSGRFREPSQVDGQQFLE
jgi:hypothetical protein